MANGRNCGDLLKQIHDELEKQANNLLRAQDLTMAQVGALLALNQTSEKQMSLKDLERWLHVAQSTAAGIASRLEQKGFVEAFGDPTDKRIKMLRITSSGMSCCKTAEKNMIATEQKLLSGLTEEEQAIFKMFLLKVRNSLK